MSQPVTVAELTSRTSPLRRIIGLLGMLALVPTAWLLVHGDLTLTDAGKRAAITLLAVQVVLRLTTWGIGHLAGFLERTDEPPETEAPTAP
jgi:hypothetical protein